MVDNYIINLEDFYQNNTIESWGTWTERMTLVQGFGYSSYHYKILLRDSKGREYFVWYYSKLEASNGSTIVVTLRQDCSSCDLYFKKLTNTKNGRESDVYSWLKA